MEIVLQNLMRGLKLGLVLAAFLSLGCGRDISHIKTLEKKGKYYEAWEAYQSFVARHPEHSQAPEALFRAGLLAQKQLKDCFMAGTFFDQLLERYPQSDPWARAALHEKNNCPDFFPLLPGSRWTE